MDYLRVRSSDLVGGGGGGGGGVRGGVNCPDILELMISKCHSGASHVKF